MATYDEVLKRINTPRLITSQKRSFSKQLDAFLGDTGRLLRADNSYPGGLLEVGVAQLWRYSCLGVA